MTASPCQVLVLCTGNSARSILGEALITHRGRGRFVGHSAGSKPKGRVHPVALQVLEHHGLPTTGLRSKSWDEFASPGAPALDVVITVCDNAAGESCPYWPGSPLRTHWGLEDPAAVTGSSAEQWQAFQKTFDELQRRIDRFVALPFQSLDRQQLQAELDAIGALGEAAR